MREQETEPDRYARAVDEIELAVLGAPEDADRLSAVIEVMCRVMANDEQIPDSRFFHHLQAIVPARVATIILENNEACGHA